MSAPRWLLLAGGVNALLAIITGAFGAHALEETLSPRMLEVWATAAQYHFWHALGLILVGVVSRQLGVSRLFSLAGWMMLAGIVLFCGSLYALSLSGLTQLGMITPLGGLAFMGSWILFSLAVVRAEP